MKIFNLFYTLSFVMLISSSYSLISSPSSDNKKKISEAKADQQEVLLETLGTVSAQGLYLTYMSIGTLSDGFVSQAYDKETTKTIMNSYLNLSKTCKTQLALLIKEGNLDAEDKKILQEIEITYGHLIGQGQAFLDYIESTDASHLKAFESNRKSAWQKIEKILNIKD